jgi:hypothetical protein
VDNKSLRLEVQDLKRENKQLAKQLSVAEKAIKAFEKERELLNEQIEKAGGALNETVREQIVRDALEKYFTKPQLDRLLLQKNTHWTQKDFCDAMMLLCLSARAYRCLREKLSMPFPSISSVQKFLSLLHCVPGLLIAVIKLLESQSFSLSPKEKLLAVNFDEVKIAGVACYYQKEDRVFVNMDSAQVFYARAIFGGWGCPIYYDFNIANSPELMRFLGSKLEEAGYEDSIWNSDLGPLNQKLHKQLGVTPSKPYYVDPDTGKKKYIFSDSPHNTKNGRSHLVDDSAVLGPSSGLDEDGNPLIASVEPMKELLDLTDAEFQTLPLTWMHIEARKQDRQKVIWAVEMLCEKVASALERAGLAGYLGQHWKVHRYKI